jgi:hypothetical protein
VISVTPRPCFSPGERIPGTHCAGGWVGPTAGLDTVARGKILSPLPGIEPRSPGRPTRSQTQYWLSYPAHLIFFIVCIINYRPTTQPHLVPRLRMSRSYTSSPPCASRGMLWDCFNNYPPHSKSFK